jgi:hypothetical protein
MAEIVKSLEAHFAEQKRKAEVAREEYFAGLPEEDRAAARDMDAIVRESWRRIEQANIDSILFGYGEATCLLTGNKYVFVTGVYDP